MAGGVDLLFPVILSDFFLQFFPLSALNRFCVTHYGGQRETPKVERMRMREREEEIVKACQLRYEKSDRVYRGWLRRLSDETLVQYTCKLVRAFTRRYTAFIVGTVEDAYDVLKGNLFFNESEGVFERLLFAKGLAVADIDSVESRNVHDAIVSRGKGAVLIGALEELIDRVRASVFADLPLATVLVRKVVAKTR